MFRKLLILSFQNYKTNQTLQVLPPWDICLFCFRDTGYWYPTPWARLTNIRNHRKMTKANYKLCLKNIYRWKTKQANKRKRKQSKNCATFLVLCDLVLSTIKQHIYEKPVKWSVRLFLDNITLMFLLNFQLEVIINMFIKREPTPYMEQEVNTPYSTSNFCSNKGTESDQNY
jgi:hypothetical protein